MLWEQLEVVKEAKFLVELVMPNELEVVQELEMELELELEQELKLKLIKVQEFEEELELKEESMIMPRVLITIKLVKFQKIAITVSEPHFN
jgi:hypothetical protein